MRRFVSFLVAVSMLFSSVNGYAQSVSLPQPGSMISLSGAFTPVILKGMVIHPEDPLVFDFVVDNGNTGLKDAALTDETTHLVKYFLAGIAIPEKDLWVNLSPLEKDRIIEQGLSQTEMGRDMLAQDYMLKQMVSSLIYPESDLGREFWSKVYAEAQEKFGSTEVPVDTFNKVWIMPGSATVYRDGNKVMIADAKLKVMMEKDYLAMQQGQANVESTDLSTQLMREIVIPVLEKEVNEGKNFVQIRQLFHSLILANYYKNALKQSLLAQIYADSQKTNGINIADPKAQVETIYGQYVEAFKTGVFNYIKEDIDRVSGESVPHKYFSGGAVMKMNVDEAQLDRVRPAVGDAAMIEYRLTPSGSDAAQRVSPKSVQIIDASWHGDDVTYTTNYGPVRIWREGKGKIIGQKGRGPRYVFQDKSSMSFLTRERANPQTAVARIMNGDAAMRGDVDGVVQALYNRIPENRRVALEKISQEKVVEVRLQIAEAVSKLRSMIDFKGAKGRVPSDEEIMDSLIDTNAFYPALFDKDFTAKLGETAVPPTFVFEGSVFTTYPGKKKPQVMAITLGDGFFAATATSVNLPNYKKYGVWKQKGLLSPSFDLKRFLLAKGGVRIYQLGKNLKGTLEDKLRGNGTKPLAEEVSDLAFGMSGKVPAEILFEGGKTTLILDEAADPSKVIRSWTRSSILAGVLGRLYDAGPDMGSADLMGDLQEEANTVHGLLGLPQIPVTTSIAGEIASFDHFKWTVTSISAFESFMVIFQDPWIRARYGIKDKVDLVIQGFGDVGSGLVKYISEKYGSLLDNGTIRFVAVADITGGIYDPQGLNVRELLRLRDLDPKKLSVKRDYVVPSGHKVETFEKGTDVFFVRKSGSDPERSGIAFPAAGPGVFQTREDAERLKASGVDVLVSPANNVLKENIGLEAVLEEIKVLYLSASSVSHGGIQTSSEEIFHIVYEGLESLRAKVTADEPGWKSHIQDGIIGLTQSLITWELEKFKAAIKRGENVTFHGIHMALAEQIQGEKDFLLSLPPTPIFDRLNEEVRAVWAQYEEQGKTLTVDQRDAVSLIIILNRIVEESRTFAMYAWKDRNNIVKARLATLEKMLENPSDVSLVDQKIAAYELGRFAATEAKEDLRRVLVDPRFDPIVRGFAAEAFVSIGVIQDVPFLQEVVRNARSAGLPDISFAANLAVERITAIDKTKTSDAAMSGFLFNEPAHEAYSTLGQERVLFLGEEGKRTEVVLDEDWGLFDDALRLPGGRGWLLHFKRMLIHVDGNGKPAGSYYGTLGNKLSYAESDGGITVTYDIGKVTLTSDGMFRVVAEGKKIPGLFVGDPKSQTWGGLSVALANYAIQGIWNAVNSDERVNGPFRIWHADMGGEALARNRADEQIARELAKKISGLRVSLKRKDTWDPEFSDDSEGLILRRTLAGKAARLVQGKNERSLADEISDALIDLVQKPMQVKEDLQVPNIEIAARTLKEWAKNPDVVREVAVESQDGRVVGVTAKVAVPEIPVADPNDFAFQAGLLRAAITTVSGLIDTGEVLNVQVGLVNDQYEQLSLGRYLVNVRITPADAAMTRHEGGIDLRNSDFMKTIDKDASGMPVFDPAQIQILKQDLRGFVPVPAGVPQPLNFRTFLGLSHGLLNTQSASTSMIPDQALAVMREEAGV